MISPIIRIIGYREYIDKIENMSTKLANQFRTELLDDPKSGNMLTTYRDHTAFDTTPGKRIRSNRKNIAIFDFRTAERSFPCH